MIVNKPPMGWNTWNTFMEDIDEEKVTEGWFRTKNVFPMG